MITASLAVTAFAMGLAGGPHCLAMCGAACAGVAGLRAPGAARGRALWGFQLGRLAGYSALGAVAAATVQGIGWLGTQTAALRPFWTLLHVAALLLGLVLLVRARQPLWLGDTARGVWSRVRGAGARPGAPLIIGALWALLPCGLLYSALLVAALAGDPLGGALVMGLFALGSGLTLVAGPWLWLRLAAWRVKPGARAAGLTANPSATDGTRAAAGAWGVRLAGAALAVSSAWVLLHGTALAQAVLAWCA